MFSKFRIISLLLLISVSIKGVYSCQPIIPKHPFRNSKVVFFGKLVEVSETNDKCSSVAKFKVEKYWKGNPDEFISVETPTTLCCGFNFQIGENYLIYAYSEKSLRLETSDGWILAESLDDLIDKRLKKSGKGKTLN